MTRSTAHKRAVSALASELGVPRRVAGSVLAKRRRCEHVLGHGPTCPKCGAYAPAEASRNPKEARP